MNQTDEALNFRFQMSPNTLAVPAEWQGEYFPSYIPDGFELVSISPIGVRYKNADGVEIEFMEMDPSAGFSMDSEHSVVSYERVGGRMAVISEWDNSTMIVFTEGDRILTVDVIDNHETGYTNKDVAMQIAESILLLQ